LAESAAKQEAFEEANRIKNQFRALDDDEVEFLDSVLQSTRAEEERVRRETAAGLALFRQQQDEVDKKVRRDNDKPVVDDGPPTVEDESWVASGRKRKRTKEKDGLKGVKLRRSSTSTESKIYPSLDAEKTTVASSRKENMSPTNPTVQSQSTQELPESKLKPQVVAKKPPANASLVNYGSDEDDDW
jgi:hypothetical protein